MGLYLLDEHAGQLTDDEFSLEKSDPSLNGSNAHSFVHEYRLNAVDFNRLFFSRYNLEYISRYCVSEKIDFRVVAHPYKTDTCFQKAELLSAWDPLNVIKALYFECSSDSSLYAVVVPETGCFINRPRLKSILDLPENSFIRKAESLPDNMSFGTCSPFITDKDIKRNGGKVEKILFDLETLKIKKQEKAVDDFSFGLDHRLSIQMNYYHCYKMLKKLFPDVVEKREVLNLSFKEKLVRTNGKINISYEFSSLNYKTAKFINGIHGFGDVSILNDYVDELDLPNVLTESKNVHAQK
jgi:hypothetical protein